MYEALIFKRGARKINVREIGVREKKDARILKLSEN